jgi:hypothetical protein
MSFDEAVEEPREVMKRREALGAIISVERLRNELLTDMLKVGAMFGGGTFVFGLIFGHEVNFPWVVALSLAASIAFIFAYLGATLAFEGLVDSEIRRRLRERG